MGSIWNHQRSQGKPLPSSQFEKCYPYFYVLGTYFRFNPKAGLNLFYPSRFKPGLNRGLIRNRILLPTLNFKSQIQDKLWFEESRPHVNTRASTPLSKANLGICVGYLSRPMRVWLAKRSQLGKSHWIVFINFIAILHSNFTHSSITHCSFILHSLQTYRTIDRRGITTASIG